VPAFRSWLETHGVLMAAALADIDESARTQVNEAFAFAYASPPPDKDEASVDVFADLKGAVRL
jgi:pyruvate dehydrogenase E1 component alpha subunit